MADEQKNIQEAIKMLKSSKATERMQACVTLRYTSIISQEAIDALENAKNDHDRLVSVAAVKALAAHFSPAPPRETSEGQPSPTLNKGSPATISTPIPQLEEKESSPKWEHHWEFVFLDNGEYVLLVGNKKMTGRAVWNYLASLGKYGWELVSVAPQIGDTNPDKGKKSTAFMNMFDMAMAGPRLTSLTQHKTGTTGYFFWYKRPT